MRLTIRPSWGDSTNNSKKNPAAEFIITQIVGTVDKPTKPVINCIYNAQKI